MAFGESADRSAACIVDSDRDEVGEPLARRIEHTERPVLGIDDSAGDADDPVQHRVHVELGADVEHRLEQSPELARAGHVFHDRSVGLARPQARL